MNMMRSKILYFTFFIVILSINFSEGKDAGKENNFLNSDVILGVVTALVGAAAGVSASYGYKYYKSNDRLVQISGHPGDLNPIDISPIDVKPSDVKPSDEEISHWFWKGLNAIPYKYAIGVPLTIAILAYQYNNILTAGSISGDYIVDGVYSAAGAFAAAMHGAKNLASDIYTIGESSARIIGTTAKVGGSTLKFAADTTKTVASGSIAAADAVSSVYNARNYTSDFNAIKDFTVESCNSAADLYNTVNDNHPGITKAVNYGTIGGFAGVGGHRFIYPKVLAAYAAVMSALTSTTAKFGYGGVGVAMLPLIMQSVSWTGAGTTNTMFDNSIYPNSTLP